MVKQVRGVSFNFVINVNAYSGRDLPLLKRYSFFGKKKSIGHYRNMLIIRNLKRWRGEGEIPMTFFLFCLIDSGTRISVTFFSRLHELTDLFLLALSFFCNILPFVFSPLSRLSNRLIVAYLLLRFDYR